MLLGMYGYGTLKNSLKLLRNEKWELQVMICGASLTCSDNSVSGLSDNILAFVLWNNKHIFEVVQEMKSSRHLV